TSAGFALTVVIRCRSDGELKCLEKDGGYYMILGWETRTNVGYFFRLSVGQIKRDRGGRAEILFTTVKEEYYDIVHQYIRNVQYT
ncbi:MAG: hypothetical protein PVJ68_16800, partial [Candidatus Thiodiazotropha sp.]